MVQQLDLGGRFTLPGTAMILKRVGYGAMQLAGPHVWGRRAMSRPPLPFCEPRSIGA
jgi:hypothetical protein